MKGIQKIVVVLWTVVIIDADYCPAPLNAQIQECVQPVGDYAKMLNNNQDSKTSTAGNEFGAFALPNMGKRVFNDLCKLVGKFNVCVRDLRTRCQRHVTIGLIDSSYGYLCNEGYNTFMESAECLMELDRKPDVKSCHDQTLKEIERANTQTNMGLNEKVDKMCGALNFFSSCVKTPIKNECGSPAWQVIYRVLKDTTKTLMPGCAFGSKHWPKQTIESIAPPTSNHRVPDPDDQGGEAIGEMSHPTRGSRRRTTTTTTTESTTVPDFVIGTIDDKDSLLQFQLGSYPSKENPVPGPQSSVYTLPATADSSPSTTVSILTTVTLFLVLFMN